MTLKAKEQIMFKKLKLLGALFVTGFLLLLPSTSQSKEANPHRFTANAMAPLIIESKQGWQEFETQLAIAKEIGVDAISVDVWWGLAEKEADNQFDWQYYDKIFSVIDKAGLNIVAIMSLHRCGGYEGDACNYPVPKWVWNNYKAQGLNKKDLMYIGENGAMNDEFVSLWQDDIIVPQYVEFMSEFQSHFSKYENKIDEINISLGPSGELRYPSYNPRDPLCAYPTRGCFQAYSKSAIESFRKFVIQKYSSLKEINNSWKRPKKLTDFNQILPPIDSPKSTGLAKNFINENRHMTTQYGKDFTRWYHQSLVEHGERLIRASFNSFDKEFKSIPLGVKLAGIHWLMSPKAPIPRAAEMAVGTIFASDKLYSRDFGYGYRSIMEMLNEVNKTRLVFLHFTNLEGDDLDVVNGERTYSMARTQVNYVATAANDLSVPLKGENAMGFGVESEHGWNNIEDSFKRNNFSGITVLRVENITRNEIGKSRMKKFIAHKKQSSE